MDFDGDGQQDLIAGTFEGVATLVPGSAKGYKGPEALKDSLDRPILLTAYWDKPNRKWVDVDRSPEGEKHPRSHCIAVVAVDWDNDKDYDLLLGDREGRIYLRRNDGEAGKPKFAPCNELVKMNGKQLTTPGGLSMLRLVDWNEDGLFDLLSGSMEGGVYLYINKGEQAKPLFHQPEVLLAAALESETAQNQITRPARACYADAVDYDGDGDLDLIVGGMTEQREPGMNLTKEEKMELDKLGEELASLDAEMDRHFERARDPKTGKIDEAKLETKEYMKVEDRYGVVDSLIEDIKQVEDVVSHIWLYERE